MCLTATPSGAAAQTLSSPTSKQGLNREVWAALLRVRTRPECPENNLSELTWDINPDWGIAQREGEKNERGNSPAKSPNLRHRQARSQNKGLNNRASRLQTGPFPHQRQAGKDSESQKGAIAAPERHHLPNCKEASLLTKTSWDSGWSTSTRRVAARDQLPRRDTRHTWEGTPCWEPAWGIPPVTRSCGRGLDGQGKSGLRVSPWYFLSMYPKK